MKRKRIIGFAVLSVILAAAGGVYAVRAAAKPAPEAIAEAEIQPENLPAQKEALAEIPADELDKVMDDPDAGAARYRDADNNFYIYDADGRLLGVEKSEVLRISEEKRLGEDAMRELADLYLAGITDQPERYTQETFDMGESWCYVSWDAYCCGHKTTDGISVQINYDGSLRQYFARHNGDFADVTVTDEQLEACREAAIRQAFPDGETDTERLGRVWPVEDIILTHDENGVLLANVELQKERLMNDGISESWWRMMGQTYSIPVL